MKVVGIEAKTVLKVMAEAATIGGTIGFGVGSFAGIAVMIVSVNPSTGIAVMAGAGAAGQLLVGR